MALCCVLTRQTLIPLLNYTCAPCPVKSRPLALVKNGRPTTPLTSVDNLSSLPSACSSQLLLHSQLTNNTISHFIISFCLTPPLLCSRYCLAMTTEAAGKWASLQFCRKTAHHLEQTRLSQVFLLARTTCCPLSGRWRCKNIHFDAARQHSSNQFEAETREELFSILVSRQEKLSV